MLFFCMGLGLIPSKTMSESLAFRPKSVLEYVIDNNLLGAHGWSRICILAQKTLNDKMLDKIKRWVGQMEKAHKIRMKPKSQAGDEGVVPGNPRGGVLVWIPWKKKKSPLLNLSNVSHC
jgi:hypothetical protein